jgi:hypothetical protein
MSNTSYWFLTKNTGFPFCPSREQVRFGSGEMNLVLLSSETVGGMGCSPDFQAIKGNRFL